MRTPIILSLATMLLLPLTACETGTGPLASGATFTAHAVSEASMDAAPTTWTMSGHVQVFPNHSVYRQESGDKVFERPVTGLLMAPEGPDGRQVFIGILTDDVRPGTYRVRNGWGGGDRQFYGTVLAPVDDEDMRLHHRLTSGTLTIESTQPVLRGSFSTESESFTRMPRSPRVGETYQGQEGWLHVEGEIGM